MPNSSGRAKLLLPGPEILLARQEHGSNFAAVGYLEDWRSVQNRSAAMVFLFPESR